MKQIRHFAQLWTFLERNRLQAIRGENMRPREPKAAFTLLALAILVTALPLATWAQQTTSTRYYDTFTEHLLNPAKWSPIGPFCAGGLTLECVREIQSGRLRLSLRNTGDTGSDSGEQFSAVELYFSNPTPVNTITSEVTVRRPQLVTCPTSTNGQPPRTLTEIRGLFFNTGSGGPTDDVDEFEYFYVDSDNPGTINVGNWVCEGSTGPCHGNNIATYPVGTPLIGTNVWDKANHRFISTVKTKWEAGPGKSAVLPYSASDTTPAVNPERALAINVDAANCTSTRTFTHGEAFFDNVIVNALPLTQ